MTLLRRMMKSRFNAVAVISSVAVLIVFMFFNHYDIEMPEFTPMLMTKPKGCVHPKLEMWSEEYLKNYDKRTPDELAKYDCSANNQTIFIDQTGRFRYHQPQEVNCTGEGVTRIHEFSVSYSDKFNLYHGELSPFDFVHARCVNSQGQTDVFFLAGVKRMPEVDARPIPKDPGTGKNAMNILFMGYDSVSQMAMQRNMPKSLEYLEKHLGSVRLKEYNIVGDGTPAALYPILTGMTELTLPEARKANPNKVENMDGFPFIWKDLRAKGYVTQWAEDSYTVGTFTYRFVGFGKQPVDHYMRNYFVSLKNSYKECIGNKNTGELMMQWGESIFNVYPDRPIFSFIFHSEYTHNSMSVLQVADDSFHNQLVRMKESGKLDNTILIVLADHGNRYTDFRNTIQGKIEERTPYISIRYPDWFRKKYPVAMQSLEQNSKILTTPFDIHETLLDSLDYTPDKESRGQQKLVQRQTLLRKIDEARNCESAAVETHWCGCLDWKDESITSNTSAAVASHLVREINGYNEGEVPGKCHDLTVKQIVSLTSHRPTEGLLKFENSKDFDGRAAALSNTIRAGLNIRMYMIKVIVSPSDGVYEASVQYNYDNKAYTLKKTSISRVNRYGDQPNCIVDKHATLRKFCFCK